MLLEFIKGIALLLSLSLLQGFNVRLFSKHPTTERLMSGLLFGGICILGMESPVVFAPGIFFDARTVILSMAGLFGGPVVTMIAATMATGYRFWLGGAGAPIGIFTVVFSALAGLMYRHVSQKKQLQHNPAELLIFGFVLHILTVLVFTQFPNAVIQQVMQQIAIPYLITFTLGTVILGRLLQDIHDRIRTEQALHGSETRLRTILKAIPDLMVIIDEDGNYVEVLPSINNTHYYDALKLIGSNLREHNTPETTIQLLITIQSSLNKNKTQTIEYERHGKLGTRLVEGRAQPLDYTVNGKRVVIFLARDITDRKIKEDEIAYLAFYDPLTRLPNRRLLQERLQQALAYSRRSGLRGALLFIDLDNFKTLNDTMGHDIGDQLLQQVSSRLSTSVREMDTVARLGGDEFVIMLEQLSHDPALATEQSRSIGEKILHSLNQPYEVGGHENISSASIGITLFHAHDETSDELMKRADIAMYQAKAAGRNTLRFFDHKMQAIVTSRAELEKDLREGLRQQQLLLHYQPQIDLQGQLIGVEALVRWQHPIRGLVSPAEFIPMAEESSLIVTLGNWVLNEACQQLHRWSSQPTFQNVSIAVNISAKQLHQPDFVDQVIATLQTTGILPGQLKLELTEGLLLNDAEDVIRKMTALKAVGVSFSLDDFGTGYSSLAYLKRLPLDQLKIDQSFVRDLLTDPNDAAIASTIVTLAQSMDLNVIAEGVETEAQRQCLEDLGCFAYQGYLFGRPMPADQLSASFAEELRKEG